VGVDLANRNNVTPSGKPAARVDHVVDRPARLAVDDKSIERSQMFTHRVVQMHVALASLWHILHTDESKPRSVSRGLLQKVIACSLIDSALGELCQQMIDMSFFVERLLKDPGGVVVTEGFRVAACSPVGGDLVVFDALSGRD